MMNRFVIPEARLWKKIFDLRSRHIVPILDYAVEHTKSTKAFEHKYTDLLLSYPNTYHAIKLSALNFDRDVFSRLLQVARITNNNVMVDAENVAVQERIDMEVNRSILESGYKGAQLFKTYQMYRKDSLERLLKDIEFFGEEGKDLHIKLVRGAYLFQDKYSGHLHESKEDTDRDYDLAIDLLLERRDDVGSIVFATHNEASFEKIKDLRDPNCFHASLMGFNQPLSWKGSIQKMVYVPFGPYHRTYPYLLRRLYDNPFVIRPKISAPVSKPIYL